jgi:hypothetical protein
MTALGLSMLFSTSVAVACSPAFFPNVAYGNDPLSKLDQTLYDFFNNQRVRQAADCSFIGGQQDLYFGERSGEAAVNQGNGRISQKITGMPLILVDCNEMEAVLVFGRTIPGSEENSCGPYFELDPYLSPEGQLDLSAGASMDAFLATAESLEITVREDFDLGDVVGSGKDQIDLLCGCRVFYPESAGAQP